MRFSPKLKKSLSHSRFPLFNIELSFWAKVVTIAIILVVSLFVLNLTKVNQGAKNIFYSISSPIQKTFWKMGDNFSDFFAVFFEKKNFQTENEELKSKIHYLLNKNIQLKELEKENEILKKLLETGLEKEFKLEMTQIISKDIFGDSILIDRGQRDGVKENMPVISAQKVLWGRVYEVFEKYSKVVMISNPKSSLNAKIVEKDIDGVIRGKGAFKMSFDLIPKEKELILGDIVVTSQLGGIFPKDLLVGEITNIKKSDVEPFQQTEVRPFLNIKETDILFIVIDF